jgi:hypothetical protein
MLSERRPRVLRIGFAVTALVMVVALIMTGCSGDDAGRLGEQRAMLNEGYSLLYADARRIDALNMILYAKVESQEFNGVITAISTYGDELKKDLKRIARDYPAVRIDLKPLPEMETRKRAALGRDRAIALAPLSGVSRTEYERTMLIALSGALNHERHLCAVMAAEEPDPGLKKFLLASERRYGQLGDLVTGLLNREHFRRNGP